MNFISQAFSLLSSRYDQILRIGVAAVPTIAQYTCCVIIRGLQHVGLSRFTDINSSTDLSINDNETAELLLFGQCLLKINTREHINSLIPFDAIVTSLLADVPC